MAKTNITGLGKFLDRIKDAIGHFPESFYRKEIGKYVVDRIQLQARTGKTMQDGAKATALKPLSKPYIKARVAMKERGENLGEYFSPKRSNLTLTGQYIPSIKATDLIKKSRTLIIEATGNRKGESLTNKKLSKYLADGGRSIFGLDTTGRKVIKERVLREIRKQIKQKLFRGR